MKIYSLHSTIVVHNRYKVKRKISPVLERAAMIEFEIDQIIQSTLHQIRKLESQML